MATARQPVAGRGRRASAVLILVIMPFLLGGCRSQSDSAVGEASRSTVDETREVVEIDAENRDPQVMLAMASLADVQTEIRNAGKIVVLDVWSTSCKPCMESFPSLVALQKKHGDRVVCVSMCVDYAGLNKEPPESLLEKALRFLEATKANTKNFLSTDPDEEVYKVLQIPSIPAVFIYDQYGQLTKTFVDSGETKGFTYEKDVVPLVDLLATP
jgi:thiol-disulfide isomerase/thioredoxin